MSKTENTHTQWWAVYTILVILLALGFSVTGMFIFEFKGAAGHVCIFLTVLLFALLLNLLYRIISELEVVLLPVGFVASAVGAVKAIDDEKIFFITFILLFGVLLVIRFTRTADGKAPDR